jgi:CRP-like cAMP-binding protein
MSNQLLASLPLDDLRRLQPALHCVAMPWKKILYKQNQAIDRVYFPTGGACSLVKVMQDGQSAEVAAVGAEGVVGASVFLGQTVAECDVLVQLAGPDAQALNVRAFTAEMERRGAFFNTVIRAMTALSLQIQQTTACNALHRCEERCCRWLLMMRDRADSDDLKLTHEFLAIMLGVRRPTVTLVMGVLTRAGLISSGHQKGIVRILDREGLKAASCECYETIRSQMARLVPRVSDTDIVSTPEVERMARFRSSTA